VALVAAGGTFHGSGCTLAAAIAGQLAMQVPLALALDAAQAYCHSALEYSYAIGGGQRYLRAALTRMPAKQSPGCSLNR
jgi:hydroxymethylpyrimidine/phosphomethylpyrimidine kinase